MKRFGERVTQGRAQRSVLMSAVLASQLTLTTVVANAAEWTPIECPPLDSGPMARFEVVRTLDDFETGAGRWKALAGGQQARATLSRDAGAGQEGGAALRVDYEFAGDKELEYVELGSGVELGKNDRALGFWVKSKGANLSFRLRVRDKSGETHQINLSRPRGADWQFVAAPIGAQSGAWGGNGNKRLDYPCSLYSIVADRPRPGYKGKGRLWIDDVAFLRERKSTSALKIEVKDKRLGNVYLPGETVSLRIAGAGGDKVRWRLQDYWGKRVADGGAAAPKASASFALPKQGFYRCVIERLKNGRVLETRAFPCAALPEPDPKKRNTFVGLCTHFQRPSAWPIEAMDLLTRYGITQIRDEISWSGVEPKKGQYVLPQDRAAFTLRAKELGVDPLLIFCYGNSNYDNGGFPNSDEAIAGYANYCAWLAREMRGRVGAFEIWNEWSIGCGMGGKSGLKTPEPYAKMLQAAYHAIKQVDPEITVVGIGGEHSARHFDNIEVMMREGGAKAMEAFSVHSYRYPRTPEESGLRDEILKVVDLARRQGAPTRIWVTEIGWPTHTDARGVDERVQARLIVRTMALLQSIEAVDKVHWYDFKDDGLSREYNENNFGVIRHQEYNCAPKPAIVALSVFARMTAGAKPDGYWEDDGRYAVYYRLPDGQRLAVAWTIKGEKEAQAEGRDLKAHDLMGVPLPTATRVTLTQDPIYAVGREVRVGP